jgi:uncharacterized protein (TIGR03435 family)
MRNGTLSEKPVLVSGRPSGQIHWGVLNFVAIAGLFLSGIGNAPLVNGQSSQALSDSMRPSFEVASIKPNNSDWGGMNATPVVIGGHWSAENVTTKWLIGMAFQMSEFQVSGLPAWCNIKRYDIETSVDDAAFQKLHQLPRDEQRHQLLLRVQSLLADRFKLSVTHASKQFPAYSLVLIKDTSKLKQFAADPFPNTPTGFIQTSIGKDG